MKDLRAITIWQPYATLIVCGLKRFETRGWSTPYRGPLLIHAAQKWDSSRRMDCSRVISMIVDRLHAPAWSEFSSQTEEQLRLFDATMVETLGKALGIVELTGCEQMNDGRDDFENAVGFFGPGRYGWECSNPVAFATPFDCTGQQGLWTPGLKIRARIFNEVETAK